jgi:UDP-galactopyranose mutase
LLDYLIIGAGLFGATFSNIMKKNGKKCLVLEKRNHIAGNVFTKKLNDIDIHIYGPHIFNTNNEKVWNYVNQFANFNNYKHVVKANYENEIYSLPFNMHTFKELWGVESAEEAKKLLNEKKIKIKKPRNLEEQALSIVGKEIYEKLIYGYTKKQWNHEPKELPASIIKRLPFRFEYNNDYHNSTYGGIPKNGYTEIVENMLEGIQVELEVDYFSNKNYWDRLCKKILYTGPIDKFFDYKFGALEYRSLEFKQEEVEKENYQGYSQVNYTSEKVPYTRIIEHKHFNLKPNKKTIITYEYPKNWTKNAEPYYPVNTKENDLIFKKYKKEASKLKNVIINGRLGNYVYINMDQAIAMAMNVANEELSQMNI